VPAVAGGVAVTSIAGLEQDTRESLDPSRWDAPRVFAKPSAKEPPADRPSSRVDRRKQRRAVVRMAARVRSTDFKDAHFDEVLETVNVCRGGLYFVTTSGCLYPGMRLSVIRPYNSQHDSVVAEAESGRVTRLESSSGNKLGVAVQLEGSIHASPLTSPVRGASRQLPDERRLAMRYPFSATAIVFDGLSNMRLQARCSDLSREGCYIDTLNPFPEGTLAHVRLHKAEEIFEVDARVNSCFVGMGMGLGFEGLTQPQLTLLTKWLSGDYGDPLRVAFPSEVVTQDGSMDRTAAKNLIRELLSEGVLTKADLSELFSHPVL
jgi:hypothetical protein